MLQVSANTLKQVEKFKYVEVGFTSDGRRNKEIETRLGKENTVLRELYRSMVTKRDLSNTEKLLLLSVFVPILSYESWVMTTRILSQALAAEMGYMRKVCSVTIRDKVRSCEIRKALNVEPLLRIKRSQLRWFGHVTSNIGKSCWQHRELFAKSSSEVVQGPGEVITSSDLAWPRLGVEPAELSEITVAREVFGVLRFLPPRPSREEKWAWKWNIWDKFIFCQDCETFWDHGFVVFSVATTKCTPLAKPWWTCLCFCFIRSKVLVTGYFFCPIVVGLFIAFVFSFLFLWSS